MIQHVLVVGGAIGIGAATFERLCRDGFEIAFTLNDSAVAAYAWRNELAGRYGAAPVAMRSPSDDLAQTEIIIGCFLASMLPRLDWSTLPGRRMINLERPSRYRRLTAAIRQFPIADPDRKVAIESNGVATGKSDRCPIVNGRWRGRAPQRNYSTIRGAIEAYLRCLADETRNRGVNVNWIRRGMVDTRMIPTTPERDERSKSYLPMGRLARPVEIASGVTFLMSEGASYAHKSGLTIDGGVPAILG